MYPWAGMGALWMSHATSMGKKENSWQDIETPPLDPAQRIGSSLDPALLKNDTIQHACRIAQPGKKCSFIGIIQLHEYPIRRSRRLGLCSRYEQIQLPPELRIQPQITLLAFYHRGFRTFDFLGGCSPSNAIPTDLMLPDGLL